MWNKWLLIGAAFLFVCVMFTNMNRVEGMTPATPGQNPVEAEKAIKADSQQLRDTINLRDYHTNYDEIIMEAETWAQRKRVSLLTKPFTKDPKLVEEFNSLSTFIKNLDDAMSWADKN
jgi:hypothetical protein